ncbi:enoyl-CoA hydratase/isomerase family protein [Acrocarpospora catenulata]|uniref:enoyl-CoA hydratase/isomerase family protein n=1 Tax=Acrocarpospora catenulata TaxID=2836182 RepID=UPI001BD9A70C|nr:enoyl-CoA hydratase/isomerase family protein [Acrocarpospora catenulata]
MLELTRQGQADVITIRRPEARNALRIADKARLIELLKEADESDSRAIILTGEGDKAYCAGTDVKEMSTFTVADGLGMLTVERDVCDVMIGLDKPIISALNGTAAGAGCVMVYCSDIAIAAEHALIGQPEVKHGAPAGLHVALLPRVVGLARARTMLYTAEFLTAHEAKEIGLISEVVAADRLMDRAFELVERIAALPEQAIRLQKRAIEAYIREPVDAAINSTLYMVATAFQSDVPKQVIGQWVRTRGSSAA